MKGKHKVTVFAAGALRNPAPAQLGTDANWEHTGHVITGTRRRNLREKRHRGKSPTVCLRATAAAFCPSLQPAPVGAAAGALKVSGNPAAAPRGAARGKRDSETPPELPQGGGLGLRSALLNREGTEARLPPLPAPASKPACPSDQGNQGHRARSANRHQRVTSAQRSPGQTSRPRGLS